jgi:signal transduction histidine kinase
VTDLLDFAGTGLGDAIPLSRARTDLRTLCREVVGEFRAAHPARSLRFDADGDLSGEWDASRVRQVLSNLIGNAVQHGGKDCEVALTARAEGSDVVLEVRNAGTVIPPHLLPTIFDPLVRGSSPGSPRRPGSIGLGLYIVREIVDAHGGTVTVQSSAAEGTIFTARLPRHAKAAMPPEPA